MRFNARTAALGVLGGLALSAAVAMPASAQGVSAHVASSANVNAQAGAMDGACMQMMASNPEMARQCANMMAAAPGMAARCAQGMTDSSSTA